MSDSALHNGSQENTALASHGMQQSEQRGAQNSLGQWMRSDVLRELALFKGCDPEFVSKIINDVDIAFFQKGDMILQEGDNATSCYILNRGEVAVIVGGKQVAKLGAGSIFGEICLLGLSQRRTASIQALEVCDVRVVHRRMFQFALKSFPVERARFIKQAQKRMAKPRKRLDDATKTQPASCRASMGSANKQVGRSASHENPGRTAPGENIGLNASKESTQAPPRRRASLNKESTGRSAWGETTGRCASEECALSKQSPVKFAIRSFFKSIPMPPRSSQNPSAAASATRAVRFPTPPDEWTKMESDARAISNVLDTSSGAYNDVAVPDECKTTSMDPQKFKEILHGFTKPSTKLHCFDVGHHKERNEPPWLQSRGIRFERCQSAQRRRVSIEGPPTRAQSAKASTRRASR
eukprot:gnl/MRDRNA2_/MRDRNA2_122869_c0_seq1.p1 gnl/MRDRNA2_/MRDRNA2_122869_c0~~gnl/MRDRNA2_/MRDRNA2_122869_c0_seq1.p1  ORF type:complete len:411 (+),score=52.67 gnl/MRDRNA2_/MRDRNA2_122869_c0_seq1:125-1357(+)